LEFRLEHSEVKIPYRFYDCRGLGDRDRGTPYEDLRKIIGGHVKPGYKVYIYIFPLMPQLYINAIPGFILFCRETL
jgi:hypothetical protein